MSDTVLTEQRDGWVEITLNRPESLNSFNDEMHRALRLAQEGAAEARAVLLTGAGRGFCAGQDLSDRNPAKYTAPPDLSQNLERHYNPLIRQIRALPCPVICAVNGVAAGAGSSLAIACDIVLAAESAKFIQSFAKVGLVPDAGGTWSLPHLVGPARAMALALTGDPLDARTAADWGLIWKTLPDDVLMEEARRLAARLAAGPTYGLGRIKAAIQTAAQNSMEQQLELEAQAQRHCGQHPDYAEGVIAFLQKRPPRFGE